MFDVDRTVNVPHFAVKFGAERMLETLDFSATILRPSYFIENEIMVKDVILQHGVYPMPIEAKGIAMVDARTSPRSPRSNRSHCMRHSGSNAFLGRPNAI